MAKKAPTNKAAARRASQRKKARKTEKGAAKTPASRTKPTGRTRRDRKVRVDLGRALVESFLTNERINQVLLDLLDPSLWRRFPPSSKRRNIATTFAHIHNVRCMRLAMSGGPTVAKLDRAKVTLAQARKGLARSAAAMVRLIETSLDNGGHVKGFRPDVVGLVGYAITHEAHHRGQVGHWARELGAPISAEQQLDLWEWDKRWKEAASD